jgi:hypothetical protein
LLRGHDLLHALEELTFFFADMLSKRDCKRRERHSVQASALCTSESVPQQRVLFQEFLHDGLELCELRGGGEDMLFLSGEMECDLLLEKLGDFPLPRFQVDRSCLNRAIQAYA